MIQLVCVDLTKEQTMKYTELISIVLVPTNAEKEGCYGLFYVEER